MSFYRINNKKHTNGMTMVEVIISIMLLSLFINVFILVTEFTSRILGKTNNKIEGSESLIIDHHKLQIAMDYYVDSLSQPGVSLDKIIKIKQTESETLPKGCTFDPNLQWDVPLKSKLIENENWSPSKAGYAICLRSTSISESSLQDLISSANNAKPGIYVLLALPNKVSSNSLPLRRIFCRPSSFC